MKKIFCVTGATGHLGNNIVKRLVSLGEKVRALVMRGDDEFMLEGAEIRYGNILEKASLDSFFAHKKDEELYVIHAAGKVSILSEPDATVNEINVTGTKNTVDAARRAGVKSFVYVSSVHAAQCKKGLNTEKDLVFDPSLVKGAYATSKALATEYVLQAASEGFNACVIFPSGIIGVGDYKNNHLMGLLRKFIHGKLPVAVKGEYDFVDVKDVAFAAISAAEKGRRGECYLVTGGTHDIKTLLNLTAEALRLKKLRIYLSIGFVRPIAALCERRYRKKKQTPLFTSQSLEILKSGQRFDSHKAQTELSFRPTEFEKTVREAALWLAENDPPPVRRGSYGRRGKKICMTP